MKKDYTLVKLGPYGRATHAIRKGETRAVCTLSSAKCEPRTKRSRPAWARASRRAPTA